MNSWPPMSRYGIPNNSSSATSRSRSDSGEPAAGWRGAEGAPVRRRARTLRQSEFIALRKLAGADPHAFEELRLLSQLRSRPTTLNEDEIVSLRRIIGGSGTNPASRLGLNPQDPYADPHEGPRAAFAAAQRWRRRAEHPLNDPFTTRACRAAVRSAEAMVAEFSARGYDTSNVQPP